MSSYWKHISGIHYYFYKIFAPIGTIVLLIGISSAYPRPIYVDNLLVDIFIRIIICVWFYLAYKRLLNIQEYSLYRGKKWTKDDVGTRERYIYLSFGFLLGVGFGICTWWAFKTFLPFFGLINTILGFVQGVFAGLTIITHYWVLKI